MGCVYITCILREDLTEEFVSGTRIWTLSDISGYLEEVLEAAASMASNTGWDARRNTVKSRFFEPLRGTEVGSKIEGKFGRVA